MGGPTSQQLETAKIVKKMGALLYSVSWTTTVPTSSARTLRLTNAVGSNTLLLAGLG
jgi:hypothetical protein